MLKTSLASKQLIDENRKPCQAVVWDCGYNHDYDYRVDISYDVEYVFPDPVTGEEITETKIHTAKHAYLSDKDCPEDKPYRYHVLDQVNELLVKELGFNIINVYYNKWDVHTWYGKWALPCYECGKAGNTTDEYYRPVCWNHHINPEARETIKEVKDKMWRDYDALEKTRQEVQKVWLK